MLREQHLVDFGEFMIPSKSFFEFKPDICRVSKFL